MIGAVKAIVRRHWPRLRLRTILLLTFVFVAALPGFGALFLRVYENTLVRQTEAELVAQGAALAAATAADWPGAPVSALDAQDARPEPLIVDLRSSEVLPERPAPTPLGGAADGAATAAAKAIDPVLRRTTQTTLASILLLDRSGRILTGGHAGLSHAGLPEVASALAGRPATMLRRNAAYARHYPLEVLSRAADLRIHHARPVVVGGRVVGALLLSRSPPALYLGLYADGGKIAFGIVAIFLMLVGLSGLLSRGIARPIEALSLATRRVARGQGDVPGPPPTAAVEIQALYADFGTMADAIERRSRYLRDFAHAVSHEFKTPLAGIAGALELLQDHHATMSDGDRRRFLANAAADAERLALLVTRLLDLARADMSRSRAGASTDLHLPLRRLADAYGGPEFDVVVRLPAGLPPVAMAEAALESVLGSLIENGRQAGARRLVIAAEARGDRIGITLDDDGPGIAEPDRRRIFEPFFTSRRARGGTGLGLAIARSLLETWHGTIDLRPTACGTGFDITLPAA